MDATFIAFVGLLLFLGVIAYMKVPGMITKSLDERAEKISNELDEARRLREEAQEILAKYQRKRKEAEKEAENLVAAARHEADLLKKEAEQKTKEYIKRRTALVELKIKQAEVDAINEVRSTAIDVALSAASALISEKTDKATSTELFKSSIKEVKARFN